MKIKVCGMKHEANINAVAALQPDFMGFIFYPKSPRYVGGGELPEVSVSATGVFVNEKAETVAAIIDQYHLKAIQLHGSEDAAYCAAFKNRVIVFKAFGVDEYFDFEQLNSFAGSVDYFLFDTKTSKHGGSGLQFDWTLLDKYELDVPFFLSGGLSLDNLKAVRDIKHPQFIGVDLNSKFEIEPGLKDIDQLKKAFELIRN